MGSVGEDASPERGILHSASVINAPFRAYLSSAITNPDRHIEVDLPI